VADVLLGEKLITSRNPNRQTDFETKYIFEQGQDALLAVHGNDDFITVAHQTPRLSWTLERPVPAMGRSRMRQIERPSPVFCREISLPSSKTGLRYTHSIHRIPPIGVRLKRPILSVARDIRMASPVPCGFHSILNVCHDQSV